MPIADAADMITTDPVTETVVYRCVVTDRFGNTASDELMLYPNSELNIRPSGAHERYVEFGGSEELAVVRRKWKLDARVRQRR